MSKVILVTGTSTGLGTSIAVQAAKAGHKVYATMRCDEPGPSVTTD